MTDLGREPVERRGDEGQRREQLGMAVALEDLRRARRGLEAQPLAGDPFDLRIDRGVLAHRARELSDAHPGERLLEAHAVALEPERPAGELQPEGRRLGVHPCVRPMQSVSRCSSARARTAWNARSSLRGRGPRGLDGERLRGVEHVRGGEAEVEPAAVLAEGLRDRIDERRDVVVRLPLELRDPFRRRRMRDSAHPLDRGRRHDADRTPAVECRQLDLEHATEPRLVRPDPRHGGTRVASDHVAILETAPDPGTKLAHFRHEPVAHCCLSGR